MLFGLSVPVIIGPMNGGMDFPPNYNLDSRIDRFMRACLRSTATIANFVLPGKRQAALLLVANKRTYDALPGGLKSKRVLEFVENGVDLDLFAARPRRRALAMRFILFASRDWSTSNASIFWLTHVAA